MVRAGFINLGRDVLTQSFDKIRARTSEIRVPKHFCLSFFVSLVNGIMYSCSVHSTDSSFFEPIDHGNV